MTIDVPMVQQPATIQVLHDFFVGLFNELAGESIAARYVALEVNGLDKG